MFLKLHLYLQNKGNTGLCNAIISAQNAFILGYLTGREPVIHSTGDLMCSGGNICLSDLYECDLEKSDIGNYIEFSFDQGHCIYCSSCPSDRFLNNRVPIDLCAYEKFDEICSRYTNTFQYWSYKIYFDRIDVLEHLYRVFRPRDKYIWLAREILEEISIENCIHVRRGDKIFLGEQSDFSCSEILPILERNFGSEEICILSDESSDFFNCINRKLILSDFIGEKYPFLVPLEVALISILVASRSVNFVGSYNSSFSGLIHQYRRINGFYDDFRYLRTFEYESDEYGRMLGENLWSIINWHNSSHEREYENCCPKNFRFNLLGIDNFDSNRT